MKPRTRLIDWIKAKHQGQLISKTKEPYFNHLIFVAETVKKAVSFGYEIGLCHDLLEDTLTTASELEQALQGFGYDVIDAVFITNCVIELTDVFTRKAYPKLSKAERKVEEAIRLSTISPTAQTVKYADLLYNTAWVLKFTPKKALNYLQRKEALLLQMDKGDHKQWKKTCKIISTAKHSLQLHS